MGTKLVLLPQVGLLGEVALIDRIQTALGFWWPQYPAITSFLLS
jgi:hypothetical protein